MDHEPLPLRRLIDEAFVHLRRHFTTIYFPVAIPVSLVAGLMPVMQVFWFRGFGSPDQAAFRPAAFFLGFGAFMGAFLAYVVIQMFGTIAFVTASLDAIQLGSADMRRAWKKAFEPRVFGTSFLATLAAALGTLCCFVPGVYAALVFALVVQVAVSERCSGRAALTRSYALTTYNPRRSFAGDPRLKVFVVLLVGFLMAYAIGMLVAVPSIVLQQFVMFRSISAGARASPYETMRVMVWFQVPTTIFQTFAREAVALYVSFTMSLLFFDLRERREGTDLEGAIDSLTQGS